MMMLDEGEAAKGDSLAGGANLTGCWMITMLPFIIGVVRNARLGFISKLFMQSVIGVSIFALLFTYSRSTYMALGLLFLGYMLYDRKALSKRFIPVIGLAVVVITLVGFQSALFKFEFIIDKFDLTNEQYQGTNMARVYAYTRPFQLLLNDPSFIFRGQGRAFKDLREDDPDADFLKLTQGEMHSVFSASIFWRGLVAMIALFYLYYLLLRTSHRSMKQAVVNRHPDAWMPTAALISLISLLVPWLFTHYLVSKASGHMFLFFLFAIVVACLDHVKEPVSEDTKGLNAHRLSPRGKRLLSTT
jgi:hypothetical protein